VLTPEIARKIVATAEAEAARNHLAGVVAVVDGGGWPILIERMAHAAYIASVELAPGKAGRSRCSSNRVRRLTWRSAAASTP
jgi:glc operon protein GlcG